MAPISSRPLPVKVYACGRPCLSCLMRGVNSRREGTVPVTEKRAGGAAFGSRGCSPLGKFSDVAQELTVLSKKTRYIFVKSAKSGLKSPKIS